MIVTSVSLIQMWINKVSFFYGISILSIMHVTLQIPRDESVDLFWGGMLSSGRMKPNFLFKKYQIEQRFNLWSS